MPMLCTRNEIQEEERMLGAKVPRDVYRKFKTQSVMRGESMKDAILNAALMYITMNNEHNPKEGGE